MDPWLISDIVKTTIIFDYIKQIDVSIVIMCYLIYIVYKNFNEELCGNLIFNFKYKIGFSPNTILLKGEYTSKHTIHSSRTICLFGDNLKAMWKYINKNCKSIKKMKELSCVSNNSYDNDNNNNNNDANIFISNQKFPFVIKDNIYGKVSTNLVDKDSKDYIDIAIENVELEIFSYKQTCDELLDFINITTKAYKDEISNIKKSKKYIYTLRKITEEGNDVIWLENEFITNRTFDNMFFENKEKTLEQINFFQNNKRWYIETGNPHNLGIGLKGDPGTGKTTFIKSLANMLNRHIIIIPLNRIFSEDDFFRVFFEKRYVSSNSEDINFDDKIIVFEDIDCMDDVVLKRKSIDNNDIENIISDMITKGSNINYAALNNVNESTCINNNNINVNNHMKKKLTLSFILNILDGVIETSGRIIVMSSNYYDDLDPALTRAGRIDITLNFKKCSIDILNTMYNKFYNKKFTKKQIDTLKDYIISPCDVINITKQSKDANDFYRKILYFIQENTNK